jgi:hypothetical protein
LDSAIGNAPLLKKLENITTPSVIADARYDTGFGTQRVGVIGKVAGCAAELRAIRQQIP